MNRVALGELVEIKGGGTPDKSVAEYWDGDIPWASVKDFKSGFLDRTIDKISQRGVASSATQVIPAGSIIVPTRMAVGKVAINTIDLAINQDLKALTPKSGVDTRFLYHALLANGSKLEEQATGATVKGIKLDVLRNLKIPLPPLEEQKRIAAILDQADTLRRLRRRALDRLNTLGQAIFHEMFGELLSSQATQTSRHLSEVLRVQSGFAFKSSDFHGIGFPIVRISNLDGAAVHLANCARVSEAALGKGKNFEVFDGDLLIAMSGATIGKIGLVPRLKERTFLNQRVGKYTIKDSNALTPAFVRYLIITDSYQSLALAGAWGAAQPNVSGSQLTNMYISTPPIAKQHEFERRVAQIFSTDQETRLACQKAEILFTSLQHRAFRGEL